MYSGPSPEHSHLGLIEYIHSSAPTSLSLLPPSSQSARTMLAFKSHLMWIIAFSLLPGIILTACSHHLLYSKTVLPINTFLSKVLLPALIRHPLNPVACSQRWAGKQEVYEGELLRSIPVGGKKCRDIGLGKGKVQP